MGAAVAVVILMQLFVGEDVGLANNGDGARLWCRFGMEVPERLGLDFTLAADSAEVCVQDAAVNRWTYPTSMSLLIRAALGLDGLTTSSAEFDIRLLGVLAALSMGGLAAIATRVVPGKTGVRVGLVVLTFGLWADIGFVSYFTSYYSDPAAFIGVAALIVVVARHVRMNEHRPVDYLLVVAAALFAITAKAQLLVLVIPTIAVLLLMPWLVGRFTRRAMVGPALAAVVILAGALSYAGADGSFYADANEYNSVFFGILAESDDPVADLAEMGLPTSLAPYAGTNFFNPSGNASGEPDYKLFQREMTRTKQLKFLAAHPGRLFSMIGTTIEAMPGFRVAYLGNYENAAAGADNAIGETRLTDRWDPMSALLKTGRTGIAVWLPAVWLLAIGWGATVAIKRRFDGAWRSLGVTAAFVGSSALLAMLVVPIGDGYMELPKHTVLVVWLSAPLLAAIGVAMVAGTVSAWTRMPRPTHH